MADDEEMVSSTAAAASSAAASTVGLYKPGQKAPTPSPGSGDRVFYESLFSEKGTASEMALFWCVEHGVFQGAQADLMYREYVKRKDGKKKAPSASSSTPSKKA